MKQIVIIFFLNFVVMDVSAQDPHFSQFFSSPLTLNPAFTGKFNGDYRIVGNHRNQWPSINNAFITNTTSIDFHILSSKIKYNDMLGVGFAFLSDNSANSAVKFNYASFSTAFHKGLDEDGNNQLGIGIQATYSNMLINTINLRFEDQLTNLGFTGNTSELFNSPTLQSNYVDLNAGILFNGSSNEKNNYYAGLSMYHINQPSQKFNNAEFKVNSRLTAHAGGYYFFNENIGVHISGLYSIQGKATETIIGGTTQFVVTPTTHTPISVYAGGWLRLNDAFIPYFGLEFSNMRLGITYDINTSSLSTASLRKGGLEISLAYTHQPNTDKPINCPKF